MILKVADDVIRESLQKMIEIISSIEEGSVIQVLLPRYEFSKEIDATASADSIQIYTKAVSLLKKPRFMYTEKQVEFLLTHGVCDSVYLPVLGIDMHHKHQTIDGIACILDSSKVDEDPRYQFIDYNCEVRNLTSSIDDRDKYAVYIIPPNMIYRVLSRDEVPFSESVTMATVIHITDEVTEHANTMKEAFRINDDTFDGYTSDDEPYKRFDDGILSMEELVRDLCNEKDNNKQTQGKQRRLLYINSDSRIETELLKHMRDVLLLDK